MGPSNLCLISTPDSSEVGQGYILKNKALASKDHPISKVSCEFSGNNEDKGLNNSH